MCVFPLCDVKLAFPPIYIWKFFYLNVNLFNKINSNGFFIPKTLFSSVQLKCRFYEKKYFLPYTKPPDCWKAPKCARLHGKVVKWTRFRGKAVKRAILRGGTIKSASLHGKGVKYASFRGNFWNVLLFVGSFQNVLVFEAPNEIVGWDVKRDNSAER